MVWWVNCGYIYDLVLKSQCVMKSLFLTDIQTSLDEVYVHNDNDQKPFLIMRCRIAKRASLGGKEDVTLQFQVCL